MTVIGVRFKKAGKVYYFDPDGLEISTDDHVIVETVRGLEYGDVVIGKREIDESDIKHPLKKVIRVASLDDKIQNEENKYKAKKAYGICAEKITKHELEMKLIDVEYTFDGSKIIFYFTAEGRVDFRELVKDLASVFRTRIELRQIGVRDEAKLLNGIGQCGRALCCANWLGDFQPVSIKMAKDQNLSLNPVKISGVCGRLMCCLNYEQSTYVTLRKGLPRIGSSVKTGEGIGEVIDHNILKQEVRVKIFKPEDDSYDLIWFEKDDVRLI